MQRFPVGIDQIAHRLAHDRAKDIVARLEHRPARAEIAAENDAARRALRCLLRIGERAVFLEEDRRVRKAEAVDALLDVADHEQIALVFRERAEDRVLHGVRVLILIHRDLGVLRGQRFRQRRRRTAVIQKAHRKMLQIIEIRRVPRPLRRRERIIKGIYRVDEGEQRRGGQAAVELRLCRRLGQPSVVDRLCDSLPFLAQFFHPFEEFLVIELARRAKTGKRDIARGLYAPVPVVRHERVEQGLRLRMITLERRKIRALDDIHARDLTDGGLEERHAVQSCRLRLLHEHAAVRRVHAARIQPGAYILEKRSRVGVRLNLIIGAEDDLPQAPVVASCGQQIAQRKEFFICTLIGSLEHLLEHLRTQNLALVFVHQTEIRRDAERGRLLARERHAQRVYGRDLRAVHKEKLTAQPHGGRVLRDCRADRGRNSLAHLRRRGPGERHKQQLCDIDRVFRVGHAPQHALGQHGRLARTGRRRNEQRAAAILDRAFLFFRPFRHCRHLPAAPIPHCHPVPSAGARDRLRSRQNGRRRGSRTSRRRIGSCPGGRATLPHCPCAALRPSRAAFCAYSAQACRTARDPPPRTSGRAFSRPRP